MSSEAEGASRFDGSAKPDSDLGGSSRARPHLCFFCDTYYEDAEEAIQCCLAVEAIKVILENCGTCIKGVCQCGEAGNGGAER